LIVRAEKVQPQAFGLLWDDTAGRQGDFVFILGTGAIRAGHFEPHACFAGNCFAFF
jgi:hypothetical protein